MKFSIITPTHDFKYLNELYNSICEQTYSDWEWIIYVNGNGIHQKVQANIASDPRVKILIDKSSNHNIGYLKNRAFYSGSGDILVEMDHDDLLVDTCLEKLNKIFTENDDIGFVYSDDAKMQTNAEFKPFGKQFGWEDPYTFEYKGNSYPVMGGFEADSGSMAFIWYQPNHVRAWRSDVYKNIGGHDINFDILDDQDIICRTFLNTKFYHIKEPLYIYRVDGGNTCYKPDVNEKIQTLTVELFYKYAYKLAERDSELKNLMKVDIGGGLYPRQGYTTLDLYDADYICDLNDGIPLPDNSVGVLNASHIIEHLHDKQKTMSEIHRVLADGGWAFIEVPSTDGRGAFMDPTHCSYWNQNSFYYYTRQDQAQYIRNTTLKFQEFRLETIFPNQWYANNNIPVAIAWLRAIKSDTRRPHIKMI